MIIGGRQGGLMGREGDRFGKQRLRFESREEKRRDDMIIEQNLLEISYHFCKPADVML